MSMPALRQPKNVKKSQKMKAKPPPLLDESINKSIMSESQDFLIITMKNGQKLVVSSDAYHGILTAGELYRCVFCETEMVLDILCKERHKTSQNHRKIIENYPHVEDYKENLVRKLSGGTFYCTICNVIVLSNFLFKHMTTETHMKELQKAFIRADSYKPTSMAQTSVAFPPLPVPKKNKK